MATLAESPSVVPGLAVVALLVGLQGAEGGFPGRTWYPAAVFVTALLAVAITVLPRRARVPRRVGLAVGLLGAYAGWTFLSMIWADDGGAAWDGANRTATYAVIFALLALWPMRSRAAALLLGLFGLGTAVVGLVTLVRLGAAADPQGFFNAGRLAEPVGYKNANAALWTMGMIPCLLLASRREVPSLLRGAMLGGAGLLGALALMGQSRGSPFAVPLALLVFVLLTPGRARLLLTLLAAAVALLAVSDPVLDIYRAFEPGAAPVGEIDRAVRAVLLAAGALVVIGTVAGLIDRQLRIPSRLADGARKAGWALAAIVCVIGLGLFVAREGSPVTKVTDGWAEFKAGDKFEPGGAGSSRYSNDLGSNRYDLWRVAWELYTENPVRGVGIDNYQQDYLERGTTGEQPRFPHNFPLGVLSQTGTVGALLLLGAFLAALAAGVSAALRGARRGSGLRGATAAAGVSIFAYWLLHGSIDWFWEFPALGGAALAMLGLSASLLPRRRGPREASARPRAVPPPLAACGVGLLLGGLLGSLTMPWLAERDLTRASATWGSQPARAFAQLDRAGQLNPLSADPRLTAGSIAVRRGDLEAAERHFRAALRRNPRATFPMLELAAISSEQGRPPHEAFALLARARAASPEDSVIADAFRDVRRLKRLKISKINRELLKRVLRRAEGV